MDFLVYNRVNKADPRMVRKINLHSVFSVLRERKTLGVSEISHLTGLSISTVKTVLNDLFSMNLLVNGGEGYSTGGRRPTLYTLNLKNIFICGIELHSNYIKIGFLNLDGKILWKKVWTNQTLIPEELSYFIREGILVGCQEFGISFDCFIGVGVCLPGFVDLEGKTIMLDVQLGWKDVALGSMLEEILQIPVFLIEEANSRMIAEIEYGMVKNVSNLIYLVMGGSSLGKGIGGGLIINKEIVKGREGFTGEVGHMLIDPDGPMCSCGRKGCWEAVGSILQMIEKINKVIPDQKIQNVEELVQVLINAMNNDQKIEKIFDRFVNIQADAIANLIHILNPEFIIIGGAITIFGELFLKPLRELVKQKVMKPFLGGYKIELSKIENDSCILGASAVVLQQAIIIKQNASV